MCWHAHAHRLRKTWKSEKCISHQRSLESPHWKPRPTDTSSMVGLTNYNSAGAEQSIYSLSKRFWEQHFANCQMFADLSWEDFLDGRACPHPNLFTDISASCDFVVISCPRTQRANLSMAKAHQSQWSYTRDKFRSVNFILVVFKAFAVLCK